MRAIWSGSLSFGLVNIPIKLYSASVERGLDFDLLHDKDLSPIRFARVCRKEGVEVPYKDLVKGYEYQDGDYVVLHDEDFVKASVKKTKTIDIVDFVEESQIDPMYFEKPYYLEPDKTAAKAYSVLVAALKKSKKVGVAKFVIRSRENLGVIQPKGNFIVLNQMRFSKDIRPAKDLKIPDVKVEGREIEMALAFINQLSEPFKPQEYHDTYEEELMEVIEEKAKGKKVVAKDVPQEPTTDVADLMSLLKQSLEKTKKDREPASTSSRQQAAV